MWCNVNTPNNNNEARKNEAREKNEKSRLYEPANTINKFNKNKINK